MAENDLESCGSVLPVSIVVGCCLKGLQLGEFNIAM